MSTRFNATSDAKDRAKDTALPESLDDAIYTAVYNSGQPMKALADAIGVRYSYLAAAADANREDTQFQTRLIVPLTKATGNDAIVRYLAHAVGGVFVRVPDSLAADAHTAKSLREFSELLESVAMAMADGIVTRAEAAEVRRRMTEMFEAVIAQVNAIEASAVDVTSIHRPTAAAR